MPLLNLLRVVIYFKPKSMYYSTNQLAYIDNSAEMDVRQFRSTLLAILLASSLVSGCLSDSQDKDSISLVVEHERINGTIVETYSDGELASSSNVSLEFNFSKTTSEERLTTFGIIQSESEPITANPAETSAIIVEFSTHGIHEVTVFAIDEEGVREELLIKVRIELRMEWYESSTSEPKTLKIKPIPMNGGESPNSIIIDSTVENPELVENLGGGREVEVTWLLLDPQDDACQSRKAVVHEGESVNWKTIHFNTFEAHEFTISYDEGQDEIDIVHVISIEYAPLDSESES